MKIRVKRNSKIMMITLISVLTLSILSIFTAQTSHVNAELFPTSSEDVEASFVVYPDGRVVIAVALNSTGVTFPYTMPKTHGFLGFTKSNDLTVASADFTFIVPPEEATQFPFNTTTVSYLAECSESLASTEINCSVILPPSIASEFPFNSTDFQVTGEYSDNTVSGAITVHSLPGFVLGDLNINFQGNRTDLSLSGDVTVVYGNFYGVELDEEELVMLLEQAEGIVGTGEGSLYEMTDGTLECTKLETTKTPITGGATVDFEVTIQSEDFIQSLVSLMYGDIPGITPGEMPDEEMLYPMLNATFSSIESASFQLAYMYSQREFEFKLTTVGDVEESKAQMTSMISMLPDETIPLEVRQLIESLMNKTYCSMKSYEESITYAGGQADLEGTYTIEGDLNAEIEYIKDTLLAYIALQSISPPQPSPWQLSFINRTELEVSDLRCGFDMTEDSLALTVEGLAVLPPLNDTTATSFTLRGFFSLFEDSPQSLKVTIAGGSNATHTVMLTRSGTVPEPDETVSDNKVMIWYDQPLSNLKDMIFNIQSEAGATVSTIINPDLVNSQRPFTIDATENAATILNITEVSKPVTIVLESVTVPESVEPPPGTFKVLGNYVEVTASETDFTFSATIRMYYTLEQLSAAGLSENMLKIHYWDATLNKWVAVDSQVNTTEHYVSATIDHFSLWVLMGQPAVAIWNEPWFWAVIGVVMVIIVAVLVYAVRRKKPAPQ